MEYFLFQEYLLLRIIASVMIGVFMGGFYFDIGQDASKVLYNASYCFITVLSYLYLTIMPISLYCKYPPIAVQY